MEYRLNNRHLPVNTLTIMRIAIYFAVVASLSGVAWHYPFLFELPLIAAIGGAYWAFFARKVDTINSDILDRPE